MRVVYNNCYGGFGLSVEARDWLIARNWRFASELGEEWRGTVNVPSRVPRHDPLLADCVEALGDRASGEHARLAIETVACAYEITDCDGNETVRERYGVEGYTDDDINAARATAERERDEARAELAALRTELHEENLRDNYRAEHGCGDNSCVVERPHGMATNGGCRCGSRTLRAALQRARAELAKERADLALLTARVETEIPAVAAAVRGKTIAECVALLSASAGAERSFHREMMASNEIRDGMQALARAHALERAVSDIRALATPQPAPADSLDVDPAAGALR